MLLSILSLFAFAGLLAPASAEPDPSPIVAEEARAPAEPPSAPAEPPAAEEPRAPAEPPPSPLPSDGVAPLGGSSPGASPPALPPEGATPLQGEGTPSATEAAVAMPLGRGPTARRAPPLDPHTVRLVRLDLLLGPVWRVRELDTMVSTSVEYGRMHGFSASFHSAFIVVTDRDFVRAFDFPLGVGVVARGRLRHRALYGSVGLTGGILVHRAATDQGVVRRVDPDFSLPLRVAWTAGRVGASLAFVPGYSVRDRSYERRGATVLMRHAVRLGLVLGLHWDLSVGRAKARQLDRKRDGGR